MNKIFYRLLLYFGLIIIAYQPVLSRDISFLTDYLLTHHSQTSRPSTHPYRDYFSHGFRAGLSLSIHDFNITSTFGYSNAKIELGSTLSGVYTPSTTGTLHAMHAGFDVMYRLPFSFVLYTEIIFSGPLQFNKRYVNEQSNQFIIGDYIDGLGSLPQKLAVNPGFGFGIVPLINETLSMRVILIYRPEFRGQGLYYETGRGLTSVIGLIYHFNSTKTGSH